jgi:hypothetical protein
MTQNHYSASRLVLNKEEKEDKKLTIYIALLKYSRVSINPEQSGKR